LPQVANEHHLEGSLRRAKDYSYHPALKSDQDVHPFQGRRGPIRMLANWGFGQAPVSKNRSETVNPSHQLRPLVAIFTFDHGYPIFPDFARCEPQVDTRRNSDRTESTKNGASSVPRHPFAFSPIRRLGPCAGGSQHDQIYLSRRSETAVERRARDRNAHARCRRGPALFLCASMNGQIRFPPVKVAAQVDIPCLGQRLQAGFFPYG